MRVVIPSYGRCYGLCVGLLCVLTLLSALCLAITTIARRDYASYARFSPTSRTNCTEHIQASKQHLARAQLGYACQALEEAGCAQHYDLITQRADPLSVFLRSSSCDIDWPGYSSVSQQEIDFPLAYFITAFTDARNLELMLATIFRPHNSYCVHIDPKADPVFRRSVQQLLYCYRARYQDSYIHPATHPVSVFYMHYSIVEAELICLKDLLHNERPWSYAINMAGSEVMLFTNKELVANLSSTKKPELYMESFPMPKNNLERVEYKYQFDSFTMYIFTIASSSLTPRSTVIGAVLTILWPSPHAGVRKVDVIRRYLPVQYYISPRLYAT